MILASGSPRRKEILKKNNVVFETYISQVDEKFSTHYTKEQIAMQLALKKALDAEKQYNKGIIIAADTIVYMDEVLGKPNDKRHAVYMLNKLNGKMHEVITGVCVLRVKSIERVVFYDTTQVFFKQLNHDEINQYIDSGETWDKAGAYAIQGKGGELVDHIKGDYYNVMGLPFNKLKLVLNKQFNVKL